MQHIGTFVPWGDYRKLLAHWIHMLTLPIRFLLVILEIWLKLLAMTLKGEWVFGDVQG